VLSPFESLPRSLPLFIQSVQSSTASGLPALPKIDLSSQSALHPLSLQPLNPFLAKNRGYHSNLDTTISRFGNAPSPPFAIPRLPANNTFCRRSSGLRSSMPEAVIVSAIRTPVGRAYKGSLRATRPDDLAALAIKEALARVPALNPKDVDDV